MLHTTRWVVVIFDDTSKPTEEFHVGYQSVRNNILTTDMESAAEKAVEDCNNSMAEYPSDTVVGVVPWEDTIDLDFSYPGSLVNPDLFTWFNVECFPIPSYRVQRMRKEVV
jgi:hypothetical protein